MAATRNRLPRVWAAAARHPQGMDAVLGAVLTVLSLLTVLFGPKDNPGRSITALDVVVAVAGFLLITFRRRWPLPVLAVATVAAGSSVHDDMVPVLTVAALICLYTVASATNRSTAWRAGGTAATVFYLSGVVIGDRGWAGPESVAILAWTGMAVAAGDALRTRRAYVAAVEERAERAEQTRESEAERRVMEERLRIARELHDIVAHHIALITVQAGVAAHVLRQKPEQAEEALGHVRQAARTVLDELSSVLAVLRRADDPAPSTEPTPGLGRLAGLLDAVAAAGLRVEHSQDGDVRELPSAVDLAAYRIVQESLTNAQKHGGAPTAQLRIGYTPKGVSIAVHNPAGENAGRPGGHGLTGMRERAASVGGTLDAGSGPNGLFKVHAFLPTPAHRGASA